MAEIALLRVDNRLIHGQVTAGYVRALGIDTIVLIDDSIPEDKFLRRILELSIPSGRKLLIFSCDEAVKGWNENKFGPGKAMVIFKNIAGAYKNFQSGLPFDALQIGGVEHAVGRKLVLESIALSEEEAKLLNELEKKGVKVTFQIVSEYQHVDWDVIRRKSFNYLEDSFK